MRRVVLFALIAALSLGLLTGTGAALFSREDRIYAREETLFGDRSAADGLFMEADLASSGNEIGWHVALTFENGEISTDSRFLYRPEPDNYDFYSRRSVELSLNAWSGGTHTVGQGVANIEDIAHGNLTSDYANAVLNKILREAAQRVRPGYRRTETFRLSDYLQNFDWGLTAFLGASVIRTSDADIAKLNKIFTVSTQGFFLSVTVDRDSSGNFVGVSTYLTDEASEPRETPLSEIDRTLAQGHDAPFFDRSVAALDERGIWLAPSVTDGDGRELVEARDGPGVYFLPLTSPGDPKVYAELKTEGLRLLYPTEETIVSVELRRGGAYLELIEERADGFYLSVLDAETGELANTLKLLEGDSFSRSVESGDKCLYTLTDGSFALVTYTDTGAELAMTGRLDLQKTFEVESASVSLSQILMRDNLFAFDGQRLMIVNLSFKFYSGQAALMAAVDETGLTYVGALFFPVDFKYSGYGQDKYAKISWL